MVPNKVENSVVPNKVENSVVSEIDESYAEKWRSELRAAVDGAATTLQTNLISTLNGLATSSLRHGANITQAVGKTNS